MKTIFTQTPAGGAAHSTAFARPRTAGAVSRVPSRVSAPASLFLLSAFCFLLCSPANAAYVSFSFTNYVGTPDTNYFTLQKVGNTLADGTVIPQGLPIRVTPASDGRATNLLATGNYFVTNKFLAQAINFRAPDDSGPTVYFFTDPGVWISGGNYFVTLEFGTNATITYANVTNALGFLPLTPLQTTNLVAAATNSLNTVLRSALAQTNSSVASVTNAGTLAYSNTTAFLTVVTNTAITEANKATNNLATTYIAAANGTGTGTELTSPSLLGHVTLDSEISQTNNAATLYLAAAGGGGEYFLDITRNGSAWTNISGLTSGVTNQWRNDITNTVVVASNVLRTAQINATNDLNTTLVTRITNATNDLNSTIVTRIINATNDLKTLSDVLYLPKLNGNATNLTVHSGSNGVVRLTRRDGSITNFFPTADTDAGRAAAIFNARGTAADNELISVNSGNYFWSSTTSLIKNGVNLSWWFAPGARVYGTNLWWVDVDASTNYVAGSGQFEAIGNREPIYLTNAATVFRMECESIKSMINSAGAAAIRVGNVSHSSGPNVQITVSDLIHSAGYDGIWTDVNGAVVNVRARRIICGDNPVEITGGTTTVWADEIHSYSNTAALNLAGGTNNLYIGKSTGIWALQIGKNDIFCQQSDGRVTFLNGFTRIVGTKISSQAGDTSSPIRVNDEGLTLENVFVDASNTTSTKAIEGVGGTWNVTIGGSVSFTKTNAAVNLNTPYTQYYSGDGIGLTNLNLTVVTNYVTGTSNGLYALIGNAAGIPTLNGSGTNTTLYFTNAFWGTNNVGNTAGGTIEYSVISGGDGNTILGYANGETIAGGRTNTIQQDAGFSTISGGAFNTILNSSIANVIAGGFNNQSWSNYNTISGGYSNTVALAGYSVVPGGRENTVSANAAYSLAAGLRAKVFHSGTFAWADSTGDQFTSTAANQFLVRATGGVGINTASPGTNALSTTGNINANALSIVQKPVLVYSTNNLEVNGAGTIAANGTYTLVSSSHYTNRQNGTVVTNNGSVWQVKSGVAVLYSSSTPTNVAWTIQAGAADGPYSLFAPYLQGDGVVWIGQLTSTNLTARLPLIAPLNSTVSISTNATANGTIYTIGFAGIATNSIANTNGTGYGTLTFNGGIIATNYSGNGMGLTNLLPVAMATNTAFSNAWLRTTSATTAEWSRDGSGLTNIAAASLPGNVAYTNQNNNFTTTQSITNMTIASQVNTTVITGGGIALTNGISGAGFTTISNGAQLSSGRIHSGTAVSFGNAANQVAAQIGSSAGAGILQLYTAAAGTERVNLSGRDIAASVFSITTPTVGATINFVPPVYVTNGVARVDTATFPTNSVPAGSATKTNTLDIVYGGTPMTVATNYQVGGWMRWNTALELWSAYTP